MKTKYGIIIVGPKLISQIVARAALESYGIVALAGGSVKQRLASIFNRDAIPAGSIEIKKEDDSVDLRIHVIVEYGVNIPEVTKNLSERIAYDIKHYTGLKTRSIEIIVEGVKN